MEVQFENIFKNTIVKNYDRITKSEKKVAEYILKNPEEVAFLSSTKLGKRVNVSEATVIRFAMNAGFSGFPELQEILKNYVMERVKPSERLKNVKKTRKKAGVIHGEIFSSTMQNLQLTYHGINLETLNRIVSKIMEADKIFIVGFRRSFSIAYLLHYDLSRILKNTVLVDANYGLLYDKILEMKQKDICIGISLPRYATATYEILMHARETGCTTVAITDSLISPIAQISKYVLTVKYGVPYSFFNSNTAAFALVDCIVAEVSTKKKKSIKSLTDIEGYLRSKKTWLING